MKSFYRAGLLAIALVALAVGARAATMQCPPQLVAQTRFPTATTYTAGLDGILTGVAANDVNEMVQAGCTPIGLSNGLLGRLLGANMNSTSDQQIPWFVAPGQYYRITKITAKNCSGSVTTAAGGIYPSASKGGTAIVASGQAYSGITGNTLALDLTIATTPGLTVYQTPSAGTGPYFSLTTPQGAAMTCDLFVEGQVGQ